MKIIIDDIFRSIDHYNNGLTLFKTESPIEFASLIDKILTDKQLDDYFSINCKRVFSLSSEKKDILIKASKAKRMSNEQRR